MHFYNRILLINNEMELKPGEKVQWIKGENIGTVEIVKEITDKKVSFESGRRLLQSVIQEFLKPINSQEDLLQIQKVDNTQPQQKLDVPASNTSQPQQESKNDDGLLIHRTKIANAIEKSKKQTTLEFKLNFKFLDTSLYDFLKDNHENFDEIYQDILFEQMKSKMKQELKTFLNNTYKSE